MIISPPFLPERAAGQSDEQWLDSAMREPPSRLADTQAPEGSFPLSHNLAWHNGMHLQAPTGAGGDLPVRAIADGRVIFVSPPVRPNADVEHPQNYNPFDRPGTKTAAWTDNGCVILEHRTSIGAAGEVETEVTFFSVYMHLSALARITPAGQTAAREIQAGDSIWRKDEVGQPGQIYGHAGQIHFEICFDAANLQRLIGRAPNWVEPGEAPATPPAPTADGRTDSLFGSIYFYLPATTATVSGADLPTNHLRAAAPGSTLGTPVWVKMTADSGACTFETYDQRGVLIAALPAEPDAEYDLYEWAVARHGALPTADRARSSPSGWYELLRFGRNIGHGPGDGDRDPLPANVAHWRRIAGADRTTVWADLNSEGSFKFSDADFLPVMGWNCIDDDTSPQDQRCDSERLKRLIRDPDPANTSRMEAAQLAQRLGLADVKTKLRRVFCKFPTEWEKGSVTARYQFVSELTSFTQDPEAWPRLEAHLKAISFDGLPAGYLASDWRGHPRSLLQTFRRMGWRSDGELVQCMPRNSPAGLVPLATARTRIARWSIAINRMCRKFGLDSQLRWMHLLAQVWTETGYLRLTREAGADGARYAPYIGRGLIQITWQDKYENYNEFARITPDGGANFDLELIANDAYHAGNSSGFFWVSKDFKEPLRVASSNLSRLADAGSDPETIGRLCLWINGGGNHYDHRHIHFYFIERVTGDVPAHPAADYPRVEARTLARMEFVRETRTVNGRPVRMIVGTQRATATMNVTIDHTPQR